MQSSFVPAENASGIESPERRPHPRRTFFITIASVLVLFGLMAASAERMNYVPFPQELKPFAFRASRYLDPTGVLITSYYVDGLPSERVVRAMRGAFPDKVIQTDNAYSMSPPSTVLPDISLSLWGKESCRVDFYRQLSAPEQLYEKAKGFFGL